MSEMSRLRWLCRRGMKELDVVLGAYLERHYDAAAAEEQACFCRLLEMPDPDLYGLLLGRGGSGDPDLDALIEFLRGMSARS